MTTMSPTHFSLCATALKFADYPLVSALKPAGFVGAQLAYWWLQARDAWKDRLEGAG